MSTFTLGSNGKPSSRLPEDLHPEMIIRMDALFAAYLAKYPKDSQPFLTQTYRNFADQNKDYAQGRDNHQPRITNARAGQSLHNSYPSLAFDVAFKDSKGGIDWHSALFDNLGALAPSVDLNWGGSWHSFQDRPHFQPHNGGTLYTPLMMLQLQEPVWTEIVDPASTVSA